MYSLNQYGLSEIHLGAPIVSVDSVFTNIKNLKESGEGYVWPLKKVFLNEGAWIIFEGGGKGNTINSISTNSDQVFGPKKIKVGMTVNEIEAKGENIEVYEDLGDITFKMTPSNVLFKIDKESEKKYFDDGGNFPENLDKTARVKELVIRQ